MSSRPSPHDELGQLLGKLFDDVLTPDESQVLSRLLRENEESRRYYVRLAALHSRLLTRCTPPVLPPDFELDATISPELLSELPPIATEHHVQASKPSTPPPVVIENLHDLFDVLMLPLPFTFIMMLVALLPLAGLFLLKAAPEPMPPVMVAPQPAMAEPVVVARLTRQTSVTRWAKASASLRPGAALWQGQSVSLASGLAEIEFGSGATILLEGPAQLVFDGPGAGNLVSGRLTAQVPTEAHGFVVQTPGVTVVDLGTEFGVLVASDGTTEAHVFKGEVEVAPEAESEDATPSRRKLHEGEAVRVHGRVSGQASRIETIAAVPMLFAMQMPAPPPKATVWFAHRGDADPLAEGWIRPKSYQKGVDIAQFGLGPIDDEGTKAWAIRDRVPAGSIFYGITTTQGMTAQVRAQAKAQGWVLRARIKVIGDEPIGTGLCHCSYWDGPRTWRLRPAVGPNGMQCLVLLGESSLGKNAVVEIPDSRGRYVDYEIRYHPATDDADVYVNGRHVASGYYGIADEKGTTEEKNGSLHFGSNSDREFEMRVALVEWSMVDKE